MLSYWLPQLADWRAFGFGHFSNTFMASLPTGHGLFGAYAHYRHCDSWSKLMVMPGIGQSSFASKTFMAWRPSIRPRAEGWSSLIELPTQYVNTFCYRRLTRGPTARPLVGCSGFLSHTHIWRTSSYARRISMRRHHFAAELRTLLAGISSGADKGCCQPTTSDGARIFKGAIARLLAAQSASCAAHIGRPASIESSSLTIADDGDGPLPAMMLYIS